MFKHVSKFTKATREFVTTDHDAGDLIQVSIEKYNRKNPLSKKGKKRAKAEEMVEYNVFTCRFCKDEDIVDLEEHLKTEEHHIEINKFKKRYAQFIKMCKELILKEKIPRGKGLKKLRYYQALYNYE